MCCHTGDVPVNKTAGTFDYDVLMGMLQFRAHEAKFEIPPNPYLIDLSLMNFVDEDKVEVAFWEDPANKEIGEFLNWSMGFAGLIRPASYNEEDRRKIANSTAWDVDQLPTRIPELHRMLATPGPIDPQTGAPRPVIIYAHCKAGCDRTGELILAYRMSQVTRSQPGLMQALYSANIQECGREQNWYGTGGDEWFCVYHSMTNGDIDVGQCLNVADCEFLKDCTWPPKE